MPRIRSTALIFSLIIGCTQYSTPDSHREVFKTPEQAALSRRAENRIAWENLAVTMMRADRPDVIAIPLQDTSAFGLLLRGDGVEYRADFLPIEDDLSHHSERERETLRTELAADLRKFDAARFRSLGFEKSGPQILPQFVNDKQLDALQKEFPAAPLQTTRVMTDLSWVAAIRRVNGDMLLPIGQDLIVAWKTTPAAVDSAAVANLRLLLKKSASPIETLSFGALGRSGSLKKGIGAEVILLPEFLDVVRAEWKSSDDLVLFVPSRSGALLAERHNEQLLDKLVLEWKKIGAVATDPLCDQLLLRTTEGLSSFAYTPTTKPTVPATKPAATKPEIYIVR